MRAWNITQANNNNESSFLSYQHLTSSDVLVFYFLSSEFSILQIAFGTVTSDKCVIFFAANLSQLWNIAKFVVTIRNYNKFTCGNNP